MAVYMPCSLRYLPVSGRPDKGHIAALVVHLPKEAVPILHGNAKLGKICFEGGSEERGGEIGDYYGGIRFGVIRKFAQSRRPLFRSHDSINGIYS